jgi:Phosphodiester glycosidase
VLTRQQAPEPPEPAHLRRVRVTLDDGAATTLHVAEHDLGQTAVRVELLPGPMTLEEWCGLHGVEEALVGGFYVRDPLERTDAMLHGMPLGELRSGGVACASIPFVDPWDARRACVHVSDGAVRIARRDELAQDVDGDLLQAGPLLVRDGRVVDQAHEGFSEGAGQFDSDITAGRHPRAALGIDGNRIFAVASDGRTAGEAGLTLEELARVLVGLGARAALNLDGGGSASLVCGGRLRNMPRDGDGAVLPGGRPIATAFAFTPG